MKTTSTEIESYLYQEVVAPMRGIKLAADEKRWESSYNNPVSLASGKDLAMVVSIEPSNVMAQHNYERRRIENTSDMLLQVFRRETGDVRTLARYKRKEKHLILYEGAFRKAGIGVIMPKLHNVFDRSSVKHRITIEKGTDNGY